MLFLLLLLNPLQGLFSPENLQKAKISGVIASPGSRPDSLVLRFPSREEPSSLTVPVPAAGADWSAHGAFTFEFRSDSTIRWTLAIRNRAGQEFTYRVQPMAGVRVKAVIPRSFLSSEFMNNRQFRGYWISNWGNHIDLRAVESLTLSMTPNREVTLELGPLALVSDTPQDEVYLDRPVVDRFGQWALTDWPGKVRSLEDLERAWKREDEELTRPAAFGFCRYGGWTEKKERATGFFRAARVGDRWWLVDPDTHLFFSTGMDCVRYQDRTRVAGREVLFEKLPPGTTDTAEFYRANASLRYGEEEFVANWKAAIWRRLRSWGFNTVANWSDPALFQDPEMPFVTNVSIGRSTKNWQAFPDVYSEAFARAAAEDARRQCAPFRDEPRLIGYFMGNEPRWPQRNLVERILTDPEPSATQTFARREIARTGDTPAAREALLETLSRKYFQTVRDAIRGADPNHLVLGIRFAGQAPDPVLRANDVFDVYSINIYRFEPPADQIRRIAAVLDKPILIGEFHFGAAERGYAPSLVMVKDQTERGVAYQYYVERAAALPSIVGTHYFQLVDQPVSGRFDGENYNLGFLTQLDTPYPEMVSFARATHRRVYAVHAGAEPPVVRQARVR
jgi:hypothetical protein